MLAGSQSDGKADVLPGAICPNRISVYEHSARVHCHQLEAVRTVLRSLEPTRNVSAERCQPGGGDGSKRDVSHRVIRHQAGIRSAPHSGAEAGIDVDIDSPQFHSGQAHRAYQNANQLLHSYSLFGSLPRIEFQTLGPSLRPVTQRGNKVSTLIRLG